MSKALTKGLLAFAALALLFGSQLRAAETQSKPWIVLVGVDKYQDPQIKPRANAEHDAKALYDLYTDKKFFGASPDQVQLLLGKPDEKRNSKPATRENILKALTQATEKAGKNDLVVFAFFGQGAPQDDRTCYFAVDSTFKDRAKNSVAAVEIESILEKLKSERFCVFLDVNYKGFVSEGKTTLEPTRTKLFSEFLGGDDDKDKDPEGRVLFLATDGFTQSLDAGEDGIFAKAVVAGLKGAADKDGYEPDGAVTVEELAEYLRKEMPELARKNGKTKEEREQHHYVMGSYSSNFPLAFPAAETAKVATRLDKLRELVAAGKLNKEQGQEGVDLLSKMPKLKSYQELRKQYQALADGKVQADEFLKARKQIFANMKLPRSTSEEYAAKIIQATQVVKEGYVKELNQGDMVAWGIKGLFERIDEKKIPEALKAKLDKAKGMTEQELTNLLAEAREYLGKREDLDNHKDIDYTLQRMLVKLDPYTTYIDPETLQRFHQETTGRFTGIGIQIRQNAEKDVLQVITPIKGSPAYKAGLKAGDRITTIIREVDSDGKKLSSPDVVSTKGLKTSDAVKKILGKPNTKVKLVVDRDGVDKPLEFEITRDIIEVETVMGAKRAENDEWDYYVDPSNKIAYVRLSSFARNTSRDLNRVLTRLTKQGVKGMILDLRFNPGGLLTSAVDIADMFIDDGLIVTIKPRVGQQQAYPGESFGSHLNFPMVVLVNGYSASGSEIVAACLQDHRRAIIVGERSYGKGSVQNIQPFEKGELKMTTASFWRPNGKNLNKSSTSGKEDDDWGVKPDEGFLVKLDPASRQKLSTALQESEIIVRRDAPEKEAKDKFEDKQLDTALKYLRSQIKTAAQASTKKAG